MRIMDREVNQNMSKKHKYRLVMSFMAMAILLLIFRQSSLAAVQIHLEPTFCYGAVVDGGGLPVNAGKLKAYIEGDLKGESAFSNGSFAGLMVEGDRACIGKPITFKVEVDGIEYVANSSKPIYWQSFEIIDDILITVIFTKNDVSGLIVTGPSGTQPVGSDATFTATATDEGGNPFYQFWLHNNSGWQIVRDYSTSNNYTLNDLQPGSYVIAVYALDQQDVTAGNWGKAYSQVFILNVGSSLQLSAPANVAVGSQINLQAVDSGIIGCEYQYWYQRPDGVWHQSGAYSTSGQYTFTADQAGTYKVVAYAKDHYAPATEQFAVMDSRLVECNPSLGLLASPNCLNLFCF